MTQNDLKKSETKVYITKNYKITIWKFKAFCLALSIITLKEVNNFNLNSYSSYTI